MNFYIDKHFQIILIDAFLEELYVLYKQFDKILSLDEISELIYKKTIYYEYYKLLNKIEKDEKIKYCDAKEKYDDSFMKLHIPIKKISKKHYEFMENFKKKYSEIKLNYCFDDFWNVSMFDFYIIIKKSEIDFFLEKFEEKFLNDYSLKHIPVFSPLYKGKYPIISSYSFYRALSRLIIMFFESRIQPITFNNFYKYLNKNYFESNIKKVFDYFYFANIDILNIPISDFQEPKLVKNLKYLDTKNIILDILNIEYKRNEEYLEQKREAERLHKENRKFINRLISDIEKILLKWLDQNKNNYKKRAYVFEKDYRGSKYFEGYINKMDRFDIEIILDDIDMFGDKYLNFRRRRPLIYSDKIFLPIELFDDVKKLIKEDFEKF
ncbi:hypothetical protein SAMN02745164_02186 [Marinitoga hydrogenitolerans DSM 16785]|uniref:Uncharacterized protein n=1 Tax=Marinitoga hydrogenitolerans (strain DSM 16785 / JCM 12826 / AT1271) TaxID=1122195 RepID=A0A1M5AGN9_MARH1|nr:hypothetical protein [Marinitoga hydrogenitolerans]SHF29460.1 hypothetical protein SAMN02745164_02186 [Marinitoga hydrogenitolerans DSM 16785]